MSDLLNFILTSDDALASHVMNSVDTFRQGQPQPQAPTQSQQGQKPQQQPFQKQQWKQQQQQQPPVVNQVVNSAPKPPTQNGGFIRDMSVIPQAFYKL